VSSGGRSIFTTVNSGGEEIVSSGGAATGLVISSGGIAVVSSGGSAGATELEGGYELVASGGIVSGATISAGTLEVASGGAMASSEVAFAGGGTLQLDGGTGFGWHVAGFGTGDQIDFEDIAFVPPTGKKNQNAEVTYTAGTNQSGTLTVTDGVNTANIALLGQYMAANFTAAATATAELSSATRRRRRRRSRLGGTAMVTRDAHPEKSGRHRGVCWVCRESHSHAHQRLESGEPPKLNVQIGVEAALESAPQNRASDLRDLTKTGITQRSQCCNYESS